MKECIIIFFLGITSLAFFLICVFLSSMFLYFQENVNLEMNENNNGVFQYQYFEKDYLRNETSFGILSIFDEIDEFISFDDFECQKSVLISSFGTEEFECFGSCYCENDENFRRISHSQVLIEGVSYLLAAISSVIAFNVAKEYFSEKCSEKYSNICESKSIKSEVKNCEKVVEEYFDEEDVEKRVYFCYGNCLDNLQFGPATSQFGTSTSQFRPKTSQFRPTAKKEGLDCTKIKQEGEIIVYSNALNYKSSSAKSLSIKMRETARIKFQKYYLVPFCKENSQIEYEYQQIRYNKKSGEKKKYYATLKRIGYMCVGIRSKGGKSMQQNVRCRQIDPNPTSTNTKYWDKRWWDEKREWDKI